VSETGSSLLVVPEHRGAFGDDAFGRFAEKTARFFGTPQYIVGQTILVAAWIVLNSFAWAYRWDGRPFILLNLIFSTQAAYAAPLILLAQTRQAERDKVSEARAEQARQHAEEMAAEQVARIKVETDRLVELLNSNTELTRQDKELTERIEAVTREIHARVTKG
jgi:uncharacterized membrane protein